MRHVWDGMTKLSTQENELNDEVFELQKCDAAQKLISTISVFKPMVHSVPLCPIFSCVWLVSLAQPVS